MALILKLQTTDITTKLKVSEGAIVRFKALGEFGDNNQIFEVKYNSVEGGIVKPSIKGKVIDEYEKEIETDIQLTSRFRTNFTNAEFREKLASIDIEDDLTKLVYFYHLIVKEKIETLTGKDTVEIDLNLK